MTPDTVTTQHRDPRVALKSHPTPNDHVDGAWWPQSTDLGEQLPALLRVLQPQMKPVVRVAFHIGDWIQPLSRMRFDNNLVRLDGYRYSPSGTIKLRGSADKDLLRLLVIPPDTSPAKAAIAIEAASREGNTMTASALLELCGRRAE
jgi:hypothetical protein